VYVFSTFLNNLFLIILFFFQNPDYEKGETFFNLTAEVFDGVHYAYTNILITIEDVKTSLTEPLFMEVPVPSQESWQSCIHNRLYRFYLCFNDFSIRF
jgi:hypothetical protein